MNQQGQNFPDNGIVQSLQKNWDTYMGLYTKKKKKTS